MKFKKFTSIVLIFTLAIFLISCSTGNKENLDNDNKPVVENNSNQDKELTDKLLNEKEVSVGQVYLQGEWVIGAIIIEDGTSEEKAKEIAQSYAEKIKDKYKDKKVNVQAILEGNNIANIEL